MGLTINSNIPALNASRQTRQSSRLLSQVLERLSTGRRINRAADDAAGLAIAEGFNTQVRQGRVEINNLQSGVNLAQTAEGGLSAQQGALQRLREISLQASNGTLSDNDRQALNTEAQQLIQQIDATAENTTFNGIQVLNQDQTIDLGTAGGNEVALQSATAADYGVNALDISTATGATDAVAAIDQALAGVSERRATLGAQQNRLDTAINEREIAVIESQAAESAIRDADMARQVIQQVQASTLIQGGIASIVQSNVTPQAAVSLLGG